MYLFFGSEFKIIQALSFLDHSEFAKENWAMCKGLRSRKHMKAYENNNILQESLDMAKQLNDLCIETLMILLKVRTALKEEAAASQAEQKLNL